MFYDIDIVMWTSYFYKKYLKVEIYHHDIIYTIVALSQMYFLQDDFSESDWDVSPVEDESPSKRPVK